MRDSIAKWERFGWIRININGKREIHKIKQTWIADQLGDYGMMGYWVEVPDPTPAIEKHIVAAIAKFEDHNDRNSDGKSRYQQKLSRSENVNAIYVKKSSATSAGSFGRVKSQNILRLATGRKTVSMQITLT